MSMTCPMCKTAGTCMHKKVMIAMMGIIVLVVILLYFT